MLFKSLYVIQKYFGRTSLTRSLQNFSLVITDKSRSLSNEKDEFSCRKFTFDGQTNSQWVIRLLCINATHTCVSTCGIAIAFAPNSTSADGNVTLLSLVFMGLLLISLGSCLFSTMDIVLVSIFTGSSPTRRDDNILSPTLPIRSQAFWANSFFCREKYRGMHLF